MEMPYPLYIGAGFLCAIATSTENIPLALVATVCAAALIYSAVKHQ